MMSNLFTIFDPTTKFNLSLNWTSIIISIYLIPPMFWLIPSRISILWLTTSNYLLKEFKTLLTNKKSMILFMSLIPFILLNNLLSLFPYIFISSSHLTFTLTLALPLWISFVIFEYINNTTLMLANLTPQNTPYILIPFMVWTETISNIIRPMTLTIRLTANMIAGHLLMTLLGSAGFKTNLLTLNILILGQLTLLTLEFSVAIIQSYIFSILSALYSKETH